MFPNLTKAFTTWLPEKERVRAQGIMWLSARWGGAFTPPLVALVMRQVGWRHAFEIFGCLGVIWAVIFFRWYRNDPLLHPKLNAGERELLRESSKLAAGHGDVPWGRFLASRQVWMLCWQYFCLSYGWYFYITWLPTYLKESRHLDVTSMALFSILPLFMGGLANPVSVFVTNKLIPSLGVMAARRWIACIGFTGAAGFLVGSTLVHNPFYAMLAIGMASFSNDLVMPNAWAAAMDVGGEHAGTLPEQWISGGNVGGALGPLFVGYILKWSGDNWNLTFYVCGNDAWLACCSGCYWIRLRRSNSPRRTRSRRSTFSFSLRRVKCGVREFQRCGPRRGYFQRLHSPAFPRSEYFPWFPRTSDDSRVGTHAVTPASSQRIEPVPHAVLRVFQAVRQLSFGCLCP